MALEDWAVAIATFALVSITAYYAWQTRATVKEMKSSRQYQIQPLIWFKNSKIRVYTPSLDVDQKKGEYCFKSDLIFITSAINAGNGSCVGILFRPKLFREGFSKGEKTQIETVDISNRVECLPANSSSSVYFLMMSKCTNEIIETLSKNDAFLELPIAIFFKNSIGGSFREDINFFVASSDPKTDKFKEWLKKIKTFEIDYERDLETLNNLIKLKNNEEIRKKMEYLEPKFKECLGGLDYLTFDENDIFNIASGTFAIKPIEVNEYKTIVEEVLQNKLIKTGHFEEISLWGLDARVRVDELELELKDLKEKRRKEAELNTQLQKEKSNQK